MEFKAGRCYKDAAPTALGFHQRSIRHVLGGLNKDNEKKLSDWGFEVDESPAPKKAPIKKLNT